MTWFKDYVDKRVVLDIGCGEGLFLHKMNQAGIAAYGIEPYDPISLDPNKDFETPRNIIPQIAETSPLIDLPRMLLVIARPCHDGFAYRVIKARNPENEVLYIGKSENIEYDIRDIPYTKLDVPETGDENEVVLSIK